MADTTTKCNCKSQLSKLDKLREQALESDDITLVKKILKKFANLWLNADNDANYYKCIFDGSWPDAEEILTRNLEKIKQAKEKEPPSEFSKCCDCEKTFRTVYFGTCKRCGRKTCVDCKTGLIKETRVTGSKKVIGNEVYSLCKQCSKDLRIK